MTAREYEQGIGGAKPGIYARAKSAIYSTHPVQFDTIKHGLSLSWNFLWGGTSLEIAAARGGAQMAKDIAPGLASGLWHLPSDYMSGRAGILEGMQGLSPKIPLVGMKDVHGIERMLFPSGEAPGFLARGAGQHLRMGAARMAQAYHPKFLFGLELPIAAYFAFSETETQDLLDPYNGMARKFAKQMGMTPGALGGMAIGSAIGSIIPGIGTVAGALVGTVLGAEATGAAAEIPWKLAERGRALRLRRTMGNVFTDSHMAATSRQLSMQMIHESQMNARTALGMEAMSYHG